MKNCVKIKKPDVTDWPDVLDFELNGLPIRIDYQNQKIFIPIGSKGKRDCIGSYLIDEELILVDKEGEHLEE